MEIKILFLQVRKQTFRVTHSLLNWQMGVLGLNSDLFEMGTYVFFYFTVFLDLSKYLKSTLLIFVSIY